MYKILFIDEEKEVFDNFLDYVDETDSDRKFQVLTEYPLESMDEMIAKIIDLSPDAIITDFQLNDKKIDVAYNVPYDGVCLIETFLDMREDFPCFVITSFDDDAILISKDVNKIYIKQILHEPSIEKQSKANFLDRVEKQIQHYKSRINKSEERLEELFNLRKLGKTTLREEEEMIALDSFLEHSINKKVAIPKNLKAPRNKEYLREILSKADVLISKFESDK
ncbi:hypothetical protein [Gilliamella sp. WF3-4]|uniref:hypothetical protein n=1 Tax=Gilliamella sp. WF3-4 TaxID=3120255 RepID=UPI00080DE5E7|nr:hypothetical protein [Gilliamella apicola]OCG15152.1 hypothetical protein A9G47_13155 [Gilliamella apicola]